MSATINASTTSGLVMSSDLSGSLQLQTNSGTTALTIDTSQNVGIGITPVSQKLEVKGNQRLVGDSAYILWRDTADSASSGVIQFPSASVATIGTYVNQAMQFQTNNTERMRIDTSGNLLVGTTTASGKIVSSGATNAAFWGKNTGGASDATVIAWNAVTTGNPLFVDFYTEASATQRGSISFNRTGGLTQYNTTSDYRSKDIISPVLNSGEVIDSVPVYMGKMKGATQARPMFIAHETPDYAHTGEKDAVDKNGKPVYQQMDASSLVPVLWAEIQSLRKRVAQLESK